MTTCITYVWQTWATIFLDHTNISVMRPGHWSVQCTCIFSLLCPVSSLSGVDREEIYPWTIAYLDSFYLIFDSDCGKRLVAQHGKSPWSCTHPTIRPTIRPTIPQLVIQVAQLYSASHRGWIPLYHSFNNLLQRHGVLLRCPSNSSHRSSIQQCPTCGSSLNKSKLPDSISSVGVGFEENPPSELYHGPLTSNYYIPSQRLSRGGCVPVVPGNRNPQIEDLEDLDVCEKNSAVSSASAFYTVSCSVNWFWQIFRRSLLCMKTCK